MAKRTVAPSGRSSDRSSDRSWSAGLGASVVQLRDAGARLVGRVWDDAQTLVRGRTPGEAALRLATGALDASAEARRQAAALLRRLGGQSSRLVAVLETVLESDVARFGGTITERLGVASRTELTDLGRRLAALDRRLEALARQGAASGSQGPFPLTGELN